MANIALRSPQYKYLTAGANTAYVECTIEINGTIEYTLRKNASAGDKVTFEIAELCRDYLDITFDGTYTSQYLTIQTIVRAYNASGGAVNAATFNDKGYDGYGTFTKHNVYKRTISSSRCRNICTSRICRCSSWNNNRWCFNILFLYF